MQGYYRRFARGRKEIMDTLQVSDWGSIDRMIRAGLVLYREPSSGRHVLDLEAYLAWVSADAPEIPHICDNPKG